VTARDDALRADGVTDPLSDAPDLAPYEESLGLFDAALADLDRQAPRVADSGSEAELVRLLRDVRERRQRLADTEAYLEAKVAQEFGSGDHETAGVAFKVHAGTRRTWKDSRTLAWRVVERFVLDQRTGEFLLADPADVAFLLDRLCEAARLDWRVTALRSASVGFDDLCQVERGRRTVQFHGGTP
jgi:hypothetical protein